MGHGAAGATSPRPKGPTPSSAEPTAGGPGVVVPLGYKRGDPGAVSTAHGSPSSRVGEEGFEPSHPFGHTDLNRARLPFRHSPEWTT